MHARMHAYNNNYFISSNFDVILAAVAAVVFDPFMPKEYIHYTIHSFAVEKL